MCSGLILQRHSQPQTGSCLPLPLLSTFCLCPTSFLPVSHPIACLALPTVTYPWSGLPHRSQVCSDRGSGQGQSPDSPKERTVGMTNTVSICVGLSVLGRDGGSTTFLSRAPGSALGNSPEALPSPREGFCLWKPYSIPPSTPLFSRDPQSKSMEIEHPFIQTSSARSLTGPISQLE